MKNYLLYDAGCAVCTGVAELVEQASDGWLTVRSLGDPQMAAVVAEHDPREYDRPRLVMEGRDGVRVLSGVAMSAAMIKGLGIRRAIKVSKIVRDALQADDATGRRAFIRTVGLGAAVASGFAIGGAPAMASAGERGEGALSGAGLSSLRRQAAANVRYQAALRSAKAQGFSSKLSKSVGIDMGDEGQVLFTFMGHAQKTEREAIVISYERASGRERVALETVSGDPQEAASSSQLSKVLTVNSTAIGGSGMSTLGKTDYFRCVAFCVGANCSSKANKCLKLKFMYLVLACMVGVCGSKVKTCHKICKNKW